jgi:hypothetical protein
MARTYEAKLSEKGMNTFFYVVVIKCVFLSILFSFSGCFAEERGNWKIGGKIHFEEQNGINYIGIVPINNIMRKILHETFDVQSDFCFDNAKVVIKQENGRFVIRHYEERKRPGIGEEMHATLLYTSKQTGDSHETLKDLCTNLAQGDKTFSCKVAPTLEQVASAYHKIIKPDWQLEISDIVFWKSSISQVIVAKLLFNDRDKIVNEQGKPVSGKSLHMTLLNVDSSVVIEKKKIEEIITKLKEKLLGKMIKIGERNGLADLEFGISGSSHRVRP